MAAGTTDLNLEALEQKYAEERAKRLREDASKQYAEMNGRYANFDRDPYADPNFTRDRMGSARRNGQCLR